MLSLERVYTRSRLRCSCTRPSGPRCGEGGVFEAHQLIRGSRLALIDKCGHLPWIEQPDELWKAVEGFLTLAQPPAK